MRLEELRTMISKSARDDWHKITCWGAGSGPSYRNQWHTWWSLGEGGEGGIDLDSHGNVAVYRDDIDLTIAWGLDPDYEGHGKRDRDLQFAWAENFPDPKVTRSYVDVFWRGSLVDRMLMLHVDGGRAMFSVPAIEVTEREGGEFGKPTAWIEYIDQWEYHLGRLVHSFEHVEDYDGYLRQAGIQVR